MIIHNPEITGSLIFPRTDGTRVVMQLDSSGNLVTDDQNSSGVSTGNKPAADFSGSFTGSFTGDGSSLTGIAATSFNIDALDALGGASVAQGDNFLLSDAGTEKKVTFSNLEDSVFGNVSGDIAIAAGGAASISSGVIVNDDVNASAAIVSSKINYNGTGIVSGSGQIALSGVTGDSDDITEGSTNTFFTNARARGAISVSGDISYNSGTGVISFTERTDAEVRGLISAGGDLSYNSSTGVISFTNDAGDIEGVTAGNGLTGGGTSGTVTVNVGAGDGISVAADSVAVDATVLRTDGDSVVSGSSQIDIHSTDGYVANEHIDHSGVTLTAGNGLTGGGTIAASRTFAVGAGDGISVAADSVAVDNTVLRTTGDGVVSGSAQIDGASISNNSISLGGVSIALNGTDATPAFNLADATGYTGDSNLVTLGTVTSGTITAILPDGVISSSAQVNANTITNFDTNVRAAVSATGDLSYNSSTGVFSFTNDAGDIEGVTAGTGLTGGGTSGTVTLNVVGGDGITANADEITVDGTVLRTEGQGVVSGSAQIAIGSTTGTLAVNRGGTGATTAAGARTNLGVDAAGTDNSTDVTLANTNYLSISGQEITGGTVPIGSGGTGATSAGAARTALGVDAAGTDNSTDVTLAGSYDYITISGQTITRGQITNDDLAGSIANAKLSNSSVSYGGVSVSLGGSDATPAFDLSDATNYPSANITHDSTTGFVANEHIDHSGVSITAGAGLTGGGTIAATRTINVGAGTGVTVNANDIAIGQAVGTSDNVTFNDVTVSGNLTVDGTTTSINTTNLNVTDKLIELNRGGSTAASADGGGIFISGANESITWDNGNSRFTVSDDLNVAGNITVTGTVDGRDVASDGSKLDGIEANADVTDTANVTAAGALMDSEVDADLKTFSLPANTTISSFGKTLVDDADAAAARTTLGVDAAGTDNSTDVTLANTNYLSISGQVLTGGTVPVGSGGTGATTAAGARSALGVDAAGTDNSTDVTLAGTRNYITISGQTITRNVIDISDDTNLAAGTGVTLSGDTLSIGQAVGTGDDVTFGTVRVDDATASTSITTGALIVDGGAGISGALNVGGDVVAYASSDERLKDNIELISNPIEKVQSLKGVTWNWNENADELQQSLPNVGVIAQDVEKVLPQLVTDRDNGFKGVDYAKLTGLLIEAIKDQQKQIDELKSKLS